MGNRCGARIITGDDCREDVNTEKTALEATKMEYADELDKHVKRQEELEQDKVKLEEVLREELT